MNRISKREREGGFTLVELMLALLLFSIAIAGILSVAVSMTRSFREQRRIVDTEQAVRSPMDLIVDSLRQASPGVKTGTIGDADTCATGSLVWADDPNGDGTDTLEIVTAAGGIVSTAQSSVLQGSTSVTLPAVHAPQFAIGDYVLITNTTQGTLQKITAVGGTSLSFAASGCSSTTVWPAGGYTSTSATRPLLVRAQRVKFSIGTLTDASVSTPALFMDPDGPSGSAPPEPIAEGVEDMQIAVGVDANNNGVVDDPSEWYGDATGEVQPAGTVRAVKITLLARETTALQGGATFTAPAVLNHSPSVSDKYRRRLLTSVVEIRNLSGSP